MQSDHKKNPDTFLKAKKFCMRLISLRQRSEKEIFERMHGKKFDGAVIGRVIDSLKKEGLIDDQKFAEEWIAFRLRSNPRGKSVIKEELTTKGIQEETIEYLFEKKSDELTDRKVAAGIIESKTVNDKGPFDIKKKAKLYRLLISRGVDSGIAEDMINDITNEIERK